MPRSENNVMRLFRSDSDLDPLVVEQIRVHFQRVAASLRQLEAYKKKRGLCINGITCTHKAVPSSRGNYGYGCAKHLAAKKAGLKLAKWTAYESEYGRLQKRLKEQEKAELERAAANERKVRTNRKSKKERPSRRHLSRRAA